MKTTIKLFIILALALTVFGPNTVASAAEIFKAKGLSAEAYFSSVDPSGCIVTDAAVFARDESTQNPPGPGTPSSSVFLYISQYDYCNDLQLLYAEGFSELAITDFQISKNLQWAILNTTVNVYDYVSATNFDVYVDLTWTGIGGLSRQNSHFHFHAPGCHVNSHFQGTARSADVSGSISDGVTNFTPDPGSGTMFSSKSGDIYIGCN